MTTDLESSDCGWRWRLALLLLLTLPPLFTGISANDCLFHMEVRSLASSQETWLRQQTDPQAWLIPSWNGDPRINKPPLLVWINMLLWADLPSDAPVDLLVYRARLASVAIALLTLLAAFWAGTTLGGQRLGWATAAITGSSLLFIRQMRLASYDTYLLAFCTLTVAAGLWALQPGHPEQRRARHGWGWVIAGLSLGAGILTKGPLALLICGVPLLFIALGLPNRRRLILPGLSVVGLAAALALPWYVYVLKVVPHAVELLKTEFDANRSKPNPSWYYLGVVGLVLPWCVWLPAGLISAFRRRPNGSTVMRSALIWFSAIIILLSMHEAKQQRYIVPILPVAGLLCAGALLQSQFRKPTTYARLIGLHFGLLFVFSIVYGLFTCGQSWLVTHGWLKRLELELVPVWGFALTSAGLLLLAGLGWRQAARGHTEAVVWLTAAWMSLAATPATFGYYHAYHGQYAQRDEVVLASELTRGEPFRYLLGPFTEPKYVRPDPKFLLYGRRIVPGITLHDARQLVGPAWLTAPVHPEADRDLQEAGWIPVMDYSDQGPQRRLYHRDGPTDGS